MLISGRAEAPHDERRAQEAVRKGYALGDEPSCELKREMGE